VLHVALDAAEAEALRRRFESQRGLAPENRWLDAADLAREEPAATPRALAGLLAPMEHYVDSIRLTQAFGVAARRLGVEVRTDSAMARFVPSRGRLSAVRTSEGRIQADAVLLAAGPWTARLARRLGSNVPVRPIRGQMLSLQGPPQPLRHVIWGSRAYLVPREDGQTFVGATVEDVGFRKTTTASAQARLRRGAGELVPELSTAPQLRAWAGLRPASPDALPIMGRLPGWPNAWVSTGHFRNGILLAPISGRLMAQSILAGEPNAILAPFSPGRFAE
jgi:glycine oxidase